MVHLGRAGLNTSSASENGSAVDSSAVEPIKTGYTCTLCKEHYAGLTDVREHLTIMHQVRMGFLS